MFRISVQYITAFTVRLQDKRLVFVTNNLDISALEVASLYRERWQVELFFKWVKQNLKIKKFLGTSMNAVKTQITIALIAYVILRLVQQTKMPDQSLRHITNLTKANIFQKKTWIDLINPPDKTNVQRKIKPIRVRSMLNGTVVNVLTEAYHHITDFNGHSRSS